MEDIPSVFLGKSKQSVTVTDEGDQATVDQALLVLKKVSHFRDQKVARKGDHRYQSAYKALERVETLLRSPLWQQPATASRVSNVGVRNHPEDYARKPSDLQVVSERNRRRPAGQQEELHDCSVTSSFQSLTTNDDDATDVEPEMYDDKPQYVGKSESFEIGNDKKVLEFVMDRCKRLQQVPMKKIAKLWIKGICPRKQAVFPYSSRKTGVANTEERQPERQPLWWPRDGCKFKEPDHVSKQERNNLCIHLLRVRPTAEQLLEWNGGEMVPNEIHANQGWTKFLASLAPVSCLEELREKNKEKAARRRVLLQQLYDVAQMEEEYRDGGRDATDLFFYTDPVAQVAPSKRPKRERVSAKGNSMSSAVSLDRNPLPAKRYRGLPAEDHPSVADDATVMIDIDAMDIDPELCRTSNCKCHAAMTTNMSRSGTGTCCTIASDLQSGAPSRKNKQGDANPQQPWEIVPNAAAIPAYRQREPIYAPQPDRPAMTMPYGHDPFAAYANNPSMMPSFPAPEISVYQMRSPPQPQFNANPEQSFLPFNDRLPASSRAGLPALLYEQGDFAMQQHPTGRMPSPALARPLDSVGDYLGYQQSRLADPQDNHGWWTYPTDANTTWPAELPSLNNQYNQPF